MFRESENFVPVVAFTIIFLIVLVVFGVLVYHADQKPEAFLTAPG